MQKCQRQQVSELVCGHGKFPGLMNKEEGRLQNKWRNKLNEWTYGHVTTAYCRLNWAACCFQPLSVCRWRMYRHVAARVPPLCHIFGMAVLRPRLLHSWWISMRCGVVTGTGADMLSHCDEKHSEMMWRECSSCPQRDGKLAVALVCWCVSLWERESLCVCVCVWLHVGSSHGALVIVCIVPPVFTSHHVMLCGFTPVACFQCEAIHEHEFAESLRGLLVKVLPAHGQFVS